MDINYYKKYEPIDGKWYITKELGNGAFGTVFEIERRDFTNDKSALKIITIPSSPNEVRSYREENYDLDEKSISSYFYGFVEEFTKEFALMTKLKGQNNVVRIEDYDVKEHEDEVGWDIFIRMELLTPMNKHFAKNAPKTRDVIKLGIDICKALEVCQKYYIVHRDIKPSNIFVSQDGEFKLGDFGVARTLEKTSSGLSKKGTYTYMAPEVYKGEAYGSNVDIYSLGIVMYKLLNNNMEPYKKGRTHEDEENALIARLKGEVMPKPANADGRLAEIILKACAFESKDRYESPLQMREELENILYAENEEKLIFPKGDQLEYEPSEVPEETDLPTSGIFDIEPKAVHEDEIGDGPTRGIFDEIPTGIPEDDIGDGPTRGVFDEVTPEKEDIEYKPKDEKSKIRTIGIIAFISMTILAMACFALFGGNNIKDIENIPEEIVLAFGEQLQIEPVIVPEKVACEITYTIENTEIAMVDENGLVVAKSHDSTGGFTRLFIRAGNVEKEVSVSVAEPINANTLEEKYKEAKEYLETVSSNTTINQNDLAVEKSEIQQTLDSLENYGVSIEDISEQKLDVLVKLHDEKYVQNQIDNLSKAYAKADEITDSFTNSSNNTNNYNTKKNSGSNTSTVKTTKQKTCSVCGSTAHTSHPICPVCGSTSHTNHPVELPKENTQAPPSISYYE
ncbi:MAG: serine/threonine protein kinase [Clostridia bacterium]|nr:serine/threonine protein kinase [Clostridia bacterium]